MLFSLFYCGVLWRVI